MIFQIGGTYAKPVILPPEVAIGAIGKIQVSAKKFISFHKLTLSCCYSFVFTLVYFIKMYFVFVDLLCSINLLWFCRYF